MAAAANGARMVFGKEDAGKHRNGSGSNASPVTDGQAVFVYFKSGTLAARGIGRQGTLEDESGGKVRQGHALLGSRTSPVLTAKHVIMARMHQGESWLAAFDKADGKLAWKVARNYPHACRMRSWLLDAVGHSPSRP
jgi:hypothetical protein